MQTGFVNKFLIIFLGIVLIIGGSIAVYYYRNTAAVPTSTQTGSLIQSNQQNPFQNIATAEAAKKVQQTDELKVTIASPKAAYTFTQEEFIKVAGATKKGSTVAILGGKEPITTGTNEDGSFAPTVLLNEGVNQLTIQIFSTNGQIKTEEKTVIMLKDNLAEKQVEIHQGSKLALGAEKDQVILTSATSSTFSTTKQTKWYSFAKDLKAALKSQDIDSELPAIILSSTDSPNALAILQYANKTPLTKTVFAEINDKSVNIGGAFSFEANPIQKEQSDQNISLSVLAKTSISSRSLEGTQIKPSDIKIGDKALVVYQETEDSNNAISIYVIPGRGSSLLKDLKSAEVTAKP